MQFELWAEDNSLATPVGKVTPIFDKTAKKVSSYYEALAPLRNVSGGAGKVIGWAEKIWNFFTGFVPSALKFIHKLSKYAKAFASIPVIGPPIGKSAEIVIESIGAGLGLISGGLGAASKIGSAEHLYDEETAKRALAKNPALAKDLQDTDVQDRFVGETEGDWATIIEMTSGHGVSDNGKAIAATLARIAKWVDTASSICIAGAGISLFVFPPAAAVLGIAGTVLGTIATLLNPFKFIELAKTVWEIGRAHV